MQYTGKNIVVVFVNAFLSGDAMYNKFNRVMNGIQCNKRFIHSYKGSVNKDDLLRTIE